MGLLGVHVNVHIEAVAQQFHLQDRVLAAHGAHGVGLFTYNCALAALFRGKLLHKLRAFIQIDILTQALIKPRAVTEDLAFQLGQRLVDGLEEIILADGLGTQGDTAHGNSDLNDPLFFFPAHADIHFRLGG